MRSVVIRNSIWLVALCLCAQEQTAPNPAANPNEARGLPTRSKPSDYPVHALAGTMTIGAEFMRHAVPTPQAEFSNDDYVVVEIGLFGAPGQHIKISVDDFSLRINNKKPAVSQPYGMAIANLVDPNWAPPEAPAPKAGSFSAGGNADGGQPGDPPPAPPKMPMNLRHAMDQKVQKAAIPEGDRTLPLAGLLFFQFHGQTDKIKSVELTYNGPAGKAVLTLNP